MALRPRKIPELPLAGSATANDFLVIEKNTGNGFVTSKITGTDFAGQWDPLFTDVLEQANSSAVAAANSANVATTAGGWKEYTANTPLSIDDVGKTLGFNSSANVVLVVQNSATEFLPLNTRIDLVQYGTGALHVVGDDGVTIRSADSFNRLRTQYSAACLFQKELNEWILLGDLEA